ncbi:hypothetical protein JHK87_004642 [Glycine soja]|nr:hypothetical protein JHK87_004642 [Glycine soja]
MVTTLTSTVDDDDAPSTMDDGVALHGNLLNAPRNLFTASSSSRQQWLVAEEEKEPFPTMVTNGDASEVSKNNTKMAEAKTKNVPMFPNLLNTNPRPLQSSTVRSPPTSCAPTPSPPNSKITWG